MLIIDCFGKNIYINNDHVGYIGQNILYINGQKFAEITDYGEISMGDKKVGYIDDDGTIVINDREVGYIDGGNNFVFNRSFAKR